MYRKLLLSLLMPFILISCGDSTPDNKETNNLPQKSAFEFSVNHVNQAVNGQAFIVTLVPKDNQSISSSELKISSDIPTEINKIDETQYQLNVTRLFYEEPLIFTIKATSDNNQSVELTSQLTLTPNLAPPITYSPSYWLEEGSTNTLEFTVEDEHETTAITLEAEDQDIILRRISEYAFEVDIPHVEQERKIRFIAKVTDQYGLTTEQLLTFGIESKQPFLSFTPKRTTISNSDYNFAFYPRNFPANVSVIDTTWHIIDTEAIGVDISSTANSYIKVDIPRVLQQAQFDITASVKMSNGEYYDVVHQVSLLPFTSYKATPVNPDLITAAKEKKQQDKIPYFDLNNDGLPDNLEFEGKALYIQLQNSDGSFQNKQKAGELYFTSFGWQNTLPEIANVSVKPVKLIDFDNDGINDLLFEGFLDQLLGEWVTRPILGWIKGTSTTTFKGDFVKDIDYIWSYFLADYNNDGFTDIINYNYEVGISTFVSYNAASGMSVMPTPLTFAQLPIHTTSPDIQHHPINGTNGSALIHQANQLFWAEIYAEQPFTETPLGDKQWLMLTPVGQAESSISQPYVMEFTNKPWRVELLDINNDGVNEIIVDLYQQNEYQMIEILTP